MHTRTRGHGIQTEEVNSSVLKIFGKNGNLNKNQSIFFFASTALTTGQMNTLQWVWILAINN
jgi:hypothetical protein